MNILCGHLFGDILLQNRWIVELKRKTIYGMLLHCSLVTFGMWAFTQWECYKLVLVFVTHYIIDKYSLGKDYSSLIKQGEPFTDNPTPKWMKLLCDQIFHLITYYLISLI